MALAVETVNIFGQCLCVVSFTVRRDGAQSYSYVVSARLEPGCSVSRLSSLQRLMTVTVSCRRPAVPRCNVTALSPRSSSVRPFQPRPSRHIPPLIYY